MAYSTVVFRKWIGEDAYSGETSDNVVALFPYVDAGSGYCMSYEHVGQHGSADYDSVIERTVEATPEEYGDLATELSVAPYFYLLEVVSGESI